MGKRSIPDNCSSNIIHAENPIQNIDPDRDVGVPVAMQEHTACL
jgi:hypothetical protein